MRLWHQDLIPRLPRAQLLGQHRECCALRGNGWGRPHATVDYVFAHPRAALVAYHLAVIAEMERRGYRPDPRWKNPAHRGNAAPPDSPPPVPPAGRAYPEHTQAYLRECRALLRLRGAVLEEAVTELL